MKQSLLQSLLSQAHAQFLFWKWDREYLAASRRFQGCSHARTGFVDVGTVLEKCRDCWALRVPAFDGSDSLQWTPNSASPRHAQWVSEPARSPVQP